MNRIRSVSWTSFFLLALFACCHHGAAQYAEKSGERQFPSSTGTEERFRLVTYNVENLFDTCHNEGFDDRDFLPESERQWTGTRYWAKQGKLVRVLSAIGGDRPADMVALCEVESDSVVRDLCEYTRLKRLGYRYLVTSSRDNRGLDVALLYQPERFRPHSWHQITVEPPKGYSRYTRDILAVSGEIMTGDTLDVFVCHSPSRRGNNPSAERYRMKVMTRLRQLSDSICHVRRHPYVVITGDFNDEYPGNSLKKALSVCPVPKHEAGSVPHELYILSHHLRAEGDITGTYKYAGRWNQLDNVVVSGTFFSLDSSFRARRNSCRIFAPGFLLVRDKSDGGFRPNRTYLGNFYSGGFSDHLPLYTDFYFTVSVK